MSEVDTKNAGLLELTSDLVSAYVGNNPVPVGSLPELIANVHAALNGLGSAAASEASEPLVPAVNPKKSVFPDYIICLDDGKRFKSLKRHLTGLGMTPGEYRQKWSLPSDYPMVAPSYAAQRSALAKSIGLGRKPAVPAAVAAAVVSANPVKKAALKASQVSSGKAARPAAKAVRKSRTKATG